MSQTGRTTALQPHGFWHWLQGWLGLILLCPQLTQLII
ncbi:hypothetical protein BGP_6230 [Beggiatoa sp. PS]|nr:hypothetical protein BGP_6230 [Beggiatoa sp. PS]